MTWRWGGFATGLAIVAAVGAIYAAGTRAMGADWRTASRESAGIAPDPKTTTEAVVQVYGARAWSWRGTFGVHTWISVKPTGADKYTVYQVIGWRARYGGSALVVDDREPDGRWFGAMPDLLADLRGPGVDGVIERIADAAKRYPYSGEYRVWPGPNSNTFTAFIAREVPELRLDLPPTAIGKDYLPGGIPFGPTPSNTGYQVSLFGLLGVLAALEEGVEINFLGLVFGVDVKEPALKLPIVGRIGFGQT